MVHTDTLLLNRFDIVRLLSIGDCMAAVEQAFAFHALGKVMSPKVLGIHTDNGGFHIKAGMLGLERPYFVTKVNANFPSNRKDYGLPTIQGIVAVFDGVNGRLLSLMDSSELTIIRTGAATGIAAKYLALPDARVATICGCGNQGRISLKALMKVRQLKKIYAFDIDHTQTEKLMQEFGHLLEIVPITADSLQTALGNSQVCVTCTTSREPFIKVNDIKPGTFIAAIGADSEEKQELFPDLVASCKIVVDIAEQSAAFGEVHHAIKKGLITVADIHGELGSIITGAKPGRESGEEIIIFDSTGTALQDVAAAAIVYEKALSNNNVAKMSFI